MVNLTEEERRRRRIALGLPPDRDATLEELRAIGPQETLAPAFEPSPPEPPVPLTPEQRRQLRLDRGLPPDRDATLDELKAFGQRELVRDPEGQRGPGALGGIGNVAAFTGAPARFTAGLVLSGAERLTPGEQSIERAQREIRERGGGFAERLTATQTAPKPRFVRGATELIVDPLNIPLGALRPTQAVARGVAAGVRSVTERGAREAAEQIAAQTPEVAKLTSLIEAAKPVREVTEALKSQELRQRVAAGAQVLERGDPRGAFQRARGPLAGELPTAQFTPPELAELAPSGPEGVAGSSKAFRIEDVTDYQGIESARLTRELLGQEPVAGGGVREFRVSTRAGEPLADIRTKRTSERGVFEVDVDPDVVTREMDELVGAFTRRDIAEVAAGIMDELGADTLKGFRIGRGREQVITRTQVNSLLRRGVGQVPEQRLIPNGPRLADPSGSVPKPATSGPGLLPSEITSLFETVRGSDKQFFNRLNTGVALEKILAGELPTRGDIGLLEDTFGAPLARAILGQRPFGQKFTEGALDALNIPRSLVTAFDASAPLRQGVVLAAGHPMRFTQNVVTMFKAMARERVAVAVDDAIKNDPLFPVLAQRGPRNERGLFIAERTGVSGGLAAREEAFMSRLARRIPGIRQSERAYVTFLNKLRFDIAKDTYQGWQRAGKTITDTDIDELTLFLNRATGRGGLGPAENFAPILNATFFSPRLLTSRFTLPLSLLTANRSESAGVLWLTNNVGVRKMVAKDLAAFVGTGIGVLGLLELSDLADVNADPRSSDFGQIRVGKTRLDFWGGFRPIARLVAQLITNERKGLGTNTITGLDRSETILRFARSKLGPPAAFGTDVALGSTFLGERLSLSKRSSVRQAYERFTPFFFQDVIDAVNEQGLTGGLLASAGGLGVGVTSFDTVDDAAQAEFGTPFAELWPFEQRDARQVFTVSRDEHMIPGLAREREPSRRQQLDSQRLSQLEEVAEDSRKDRRQKIDDYFSIESEFAIRRDENGVAVFGDSGYEPIAGGTPEQAQALQEYYDSIEQAKSETGLFNNDIWQRLLRGLELKWSREGTLDYIQANTRTREIPEALRRILPNKTRQRLDASDKARDRRRSTRPRTREPATERPSQPSRPISELQVPGGVPAGAIF
jgi:hypothetical protein